MYAWERSVLHWLRPILAAALVATPIWIGVVWHDRTEARHAKLEQVCVAVVDLHDYAQSLKDYLQTFVTDQKGSDFVAGLPVPPKPTC